MSVLIKGMRMPKEGCKDCTMVQRGRIFDTCPFLKQEVNGNVERGGKPHGCPLIDVPDSLDRMTEAHEKIGYEKGFRDGYAQAMEEAIEAVGLNTWAGSRITQLQPAKFNERKEETTPTRLIKELEGKTAEEQYDFIRWLVLDYAMCFTDSREAVIEWLKGKEDE